MDTEPETWPSAYVRGSEADRQSRFWRSVWRIHFYAGMAVIPIVVTLAITGLLILYTEPINDAFDGELRQVRARAGAVTMDRQVGAVEKAFPKWSVASVTTPRNEHRSTMVVVEREGHAAREVFVDPYSAHVLGSKASGEDLPGLANRIHNNLLVDWKVKLPTAAGVLGDQEGGLFAEMDLGDLVVELLACWGVVMVATGIFLWWPRKAGAGKALFRPRLAKKGRARWRDLHAIPGVIFAGALVFLVTTGLPWSAFWGGNWGYLGDKTNSGYEFPDSPTSPLATAGDLDRFGNRIPWAAAGVAAPASPPAAEHHHAEAAAAVAARPGDESAPAPRVPARVSFRTVARVASAEGMRPGYSIAAPLDEEAEDGAMAYGAFMLANPWPSQLSAQRLLFVDQFTGKTLLDYSGDDYGALGTFTEFGIETHMGTQFGLANRIVMTGACLAVIWSAATAVVMWWKRRPKRRVGLPRRPVDVALQRQLIVFAAVLGVVFPLMGASMLLVLALDRFVIRRITRLRVAFGMR